MDSNNIVAKTLFVIGIIEIVIGFILGIILANTETYGLYGSYTEFSFAIFFISVASGIITGMLTIGLSEIIKLLDSIKKNVAKKDVEDDLELME